MKRLARLNYELYAIPELKENYNRVFIEYESKSNIEEVPEGSASAHLVFYIRHRPVVKESSASRLVLRCDLCSMLLSQV